MHATFLLLRSLRRFSAGIAIFSLAAAFLIGLSLCASPAQAQAGQPPVAKYPVQFFPLKIEGQDLRLAYRDVAPTGAANGKTVLLMHGKNFSGYYWEPTMEFLAGRGYRVIAVDQLGFGASSRPDIHYSFHQMAANTRALLDRLGVKQVTVVGHSMGGMVAVRFTLLYPDTVEKLVLENPIGLEDYRLLVPAVPIEEQYAAELAQTRDKMRDYMKTYFPGGAWQPEYENMVEDQAWIVASGEFPRAAWSSALTYQMVYQQPVVYELSAIRRPTLLIIGQDDRTVVGKNRLPSNLQSVAGQYPELGRKTQKAIAGAQLVEVPACGHIPHIQRPEMFRNALLSFLGK